jgi:hypothetical protein
MNLITLRRILLTTLFSLVAAAPFAARAADYSDMWWAIGGTESGWGVNLTQNENIIFATFYVYDANKQPIWYTSAMTLSGSSYAGPLYQTSASFFGDPVFVPPSAAGTILVGSSTFTPTSASTGTLSYNVTNIPGRGNVVVSKAIQRFTFQTILLGGNYSGVLSSTTTNCSDSSQNGTVISDIDPQVTQTQGGTLQFIVLFTNAPGSSCTISGQSVQDGQLFRVPAASYSCNFNSINTVASMSEIKATNLGIEGRLHAANVGGCTLDSTFSALLR